MTNINSKSLLLSRSYALFIGRFFNNAVVLIVMYLFAHRLSVTEYGQYQSLWIQINFFTIIAGAGIAIFSLTYTQEKLFQILNALKRKQFLFYFIGILLLGSIMYYFQRNNIHSLLLIVSFLVLFTLNNIVDAFTIVLHRLNIFMILNIGYAFLFFTIHYLFLYKQCTLTQLVAFWDILLLVKVIVGFIFITPNIIKAKKNAKASVDKAPFSLWKQLYLSDIIQVSFLWVDKFILVIFLSVQSVAMYANATVNIPFLPIAMSAISSSALLFLADKPDMLTQNRIVRYTGVVLSTMVFPLFLFLMIYSNEVVVFLFSDKYISIVHVFRCALLVLPFRAYNFTILLQKNEQGKLITQGAFYDLILAILLMYPLYLLWGLKGVALSFVISSLFQAIFYAIKISKMMNIPIVHLFPLVNWGIKLIAFALLGLLLRYLMPAYVGATPGFILSGVIMAIIAVIILIKELKKLKQLEHQIT